MSNERENHKVLSFEQKGDFYSKRARKYADRSNFTEAVSYYQKAMEKDPDNQEYRFDLAGVYSQMGLYEQSNKLLFRICHEEGAYTEDAHYGIGCNYMQMQDFVQALESFRRYLRLCPDGEYADETEDLILYLHQELQATSQDNPRYQKAFALAEEGKRLLDAQKAQEAADVLEQAVDLDPALLYAHNNLALAYYICGQRQKAVDYVDHALKMFPDSIYLLCSKAILLGIKVQNPQALAILRQLDRMKAESYEEAMKIGYLFVEAGDDKGAKKWFITAAEFKPYGRDALHAAAAACFNTQDYPQALRYWERMAKIDPKDSVAPYYRNLVKQVQEEKAFPVHVEYFPQVPIEEVVRRIEYLGECTKHSREELKARWESDAQFRSYVYWGMHLMGTEHKAAMLDILGMAGDRQAEEMLRDFLLEPQESDTLKKHVLALLKEMGAREPYLSILRGRFVEARVTEMDLPGGKHLPKEYSRVIEMCTRHLTQNHLQEYISVATEFWSEYIRSFGTHIPALKNKEAWACALECCVVEEYNLPLNFEGLCDDYDVSIAQVERYMERIEAAIYGGKNGE